MYLNLQKNFTKIIIAAALSLPLSAQATSIRVEKFSMPIKLANKISQPLNINFSAEGNWKLLVQVLDSQIRNQDNPSYSVPLTRMELAELGGVPISNFDVGKVLEIKSTDRFMSGNSINLSLNMINFECDRPGNYVADVKFTMKGQDGVTAEDVYSFRFTREEIASIDFTNRLVKLDFDKDNTLQKNSFQHLNTPFGLYVSSNKNWKLYVRRIPNSKDTTLSYFVKVLGGDSSINCNTTSDYIHLTETPILVASGKPTINDVMNCIDKKIINIDYQVKGPADKFVPAGSRTEEIEYSLETED